jgi:signal transduction histidine kinase
VQLRSAGPVKIFADAALFHRVVANLFDNEMKHLPASCTVTISLGEVGQTALLVLEDDGPGFAAEIRETMFRPRVKSAGSPGKGLGLAFVEAVVGAHGGKITAENRAEGGARLTMELALAEERVMTAV